LDFNKFFDGYELEGYKLFGAHKKDNGVEFCLWAPNAKMVEVITSKNWNETFRLEKIDSRGIWYLYIKDLEYIYSYRYRIYTNNKKYIEKSDPYAFLFEKRPDNASCMFDIDSYKYTDDLYMNLRKVDYSKPLNIYEVHLNGFKKDNDLASYKELKEKLIPYVKEMGYTHIELMPVFEHPFDGSWGYQATGFFAATSRYGSPIELMDFINECHLNNIGVLLDVVYIHFAIDSFALYKFDGSHLYEKDEKKTEWDTYNFDYSKPEVVSFLLSSGNFFLKKYHIDGLRFDAVSHFIFNSGNRDLGINDVGQAFIKRMNYHLKKENPSVLLIAEDSSDYKDVTKPVEYEGLGFDYKWDLGWMNDTLRYYSMDPIYRKYHHNLINFSMAYFYSERFILPFSHDEVVHSKKTIIDKMWGSYEDKFKQCRNLFVYMFMHPGKKLNFMGNEFAMFREFDETKELDWFMLKYPNHDSFKRMFRDLSLIYKTYPSLFASDYDWNHFKWIDADNADQSIYSFYRYDEDSCFVTILNMTPNQYEDYLIGVPYSGYYEEIINSEKDIYGGCNFLNFKKIRSSKKKMHGLNQSIKVKIAPYAAIVFKIELRKADVIHIKGNKQQSIIA